MAEPPAPAAQPDETAAAPPPDALAPTASAPDDTIPTEAAYDEERKERAEEKSQEKRQFAAKAPMPRNEHDSGSDAPGRSGGDTTEPADVSAQQLETQSAREAGLLQFHRQLRSMVDGPAGPHTLHLPSGRPAVSIASADRRTLAIDKSGELFLSKDSGVTWDKVKRQWSGRAVAVRKHANGIDATRATPAPTTDEKPSTPGAVSQPDTVFELVNDQSQVWISIDGVIWTAK
jgi:hypothetical protein